MTRGTASVHYLGPYNLGTDHREPHLRGGWAVAWMLCALGLVLVSALLPMTVWQLPLAVPISGVHLLMLGCLSAATLAFKLPLGKIVRRLFAIMAILASWGLIWVICASWEIGIRRGTELLVRGTTSGFVLFFTAELLSLDGMLAALARLRVPGLFLASIQAMCRFHHVLSREGQRMKRAREAREFSKPGLVERVGNAGQLVGAILFRAVRRSERVHAAMVARGFEDLTNP